MLSWRPDFGTAGVVDPDIFEDLMQLVMCEGFMSNPDLISTEKLSCLRVPECFLTEPYEEMDEFKEHLIPPFSLGIAGLLERLPSCNCPADMSCWHPGVGVGGDGAAQCQSNLAWTLFAQIV